MANKKNCFPLFFKLFKLMKTFCLEEYVTY